MPRTMTEQQEREDRELQSSVYPACIRDRRGALSDALHRAYAELDAERAAHAETKRERDEALRDARDLEPRLAATVQEQAAALVTLRERVRLLREALERVEYADRARWMGDAPGRGWEIARSALAETAEDDASEGGAK